MRNHHQRSSFRAQELFPRPEQVSPSKGIPAPLFYGLFALLCLTNIITLVAFLMSGDIATLLDDRTDIVRVAYQDRIVQLRQEVDRLHSRQYAQAGNLNLQLQELSHQQDVLTEQHEYVKILANKAKEIGIQVATAPDAPTVDATLVTGAITPANELPDLEYVADALQSMMKDNRKVLNDMSDAAIQSTDTIVGALADLGIASPLPTQSNEGMGGPFEPMPDQSDDNSLVDAANAAMTALDRFVAAKQIAQKAPIHAPLAGQSHVSSNFGSRKDPFLNRTAFHSGMDFAASSGTLVRSAGAGVVVHAGPQSGYGNLVEIRHQSGLITRYGHLSAYRVKEGQQVKAGEVIANVGSTGRSTGPHLHFEVRRNDEAVNPSRYLRTGNALAKFL